MQRKLSLDLDHLSVESFDTAPGSRDGRGTVRGNQIYQPDTDVCTQDGAWWCPPQSAASYCGQHTCGASCGGTCYAETCAGCVSLGVCSGSVVDATCNGYGTCGVYPCKDIP